MTKDCIITADETSLGLITYTLINERTYLNQVVEESGIEGFGECVSSVGGLFRVECDLDALFAFPHATDKFHAQLLSVDAKQIRRKLQNCHRMYRISDYYDSRHWPAL